MKKYSLVFYPLIILNLLLIFFLSIKRNDVSSDLNKNTQFITNFYNSLLLEDTKVESKTKLITVSLDTLSLFEIADHSMLFFIYSSFGCSPCIEKILQELNNVFSGSDLENVRIVVDYNSTRDVILFIQKNHIQFPVYTIPVDNSANLIKPFPYFALIDSTFSFKLVFIPITDDKATLNSYLNIVKSKIRL